MARTSTTKRRKPPKQTRIPGTEATVDKEVSDAAQNLYEVRAERMELSEKEKEAEVLLVDVLKRKKLSIYTDSDLELRVILKPAKPGSDKVEVKRIETATEQGDDE